MNTNLDPETIRKGVDDAFAWWLVDHEVSFPMLLKETIAETFNQWLESHSTELIASHLEPLTAYRSEHRTLSHNAPGECREQRALEP